MTAASLRRFVCLGAAGAGLVAMLVSFAGCGGSTTGGSTGSTSTPAPAAAAGATPTVTGASARIGALQIQSARIPQPASPDVAAAYLTIINTGSTADALVRVSTPAAASVSLHKTAESAGGVETMVPLTSLPIPADGTVSLTVGQMHLMLMNPARTLTAGETVPLTLTFRQAGTVKLVVPVIPLAGVGATPGTNESPAGTADMPGTG